jgi:hypothetical protein
MIPNKFLLEQPILEKMGNDFFLSKTVVGIIIDQSNTILSLSLNFEYFLWKEIGNTGWTP